MRDLGPGSDDREVFVFGRKSRAEKLRERAEYEAKAHLPLASLAAAGASARPILERLLYDDDLRDNIRDLVDAVRDITGEVQGERPAEVLTRLWNDDKLRGSIEAATTAAQEGSKRVRGQKVRSGGFGKKLFLLLIIGGIAYLFLSPGTGPEARRLVKETVGAITSN